MSEKSLVEDGSLKVDKAKKAVFLDPKAIVDEAEMRGHQTTEMNKDPIPVGATVDSVQDPASLTEVKEGTIAPIDKAGNPNTPLEDADMARFANQGTPDYEGEKAGFDAETLETGKKVSGHKTKAGL